MKTLSKVVIFQKKTLEHLCKTADENLFIAVLTDEGHVLNPLLNPIKTPTYFLRPNRPMTELSHRQTICCGKRF